jgi:pyrroloquinoline quinone biosynthesis protein D
VDAHAPVTGTPGPGPGSVPRVASKARLQWDDVRQRDVLLYPEGLVALNPTGAEILRLCDGRRRLEEIMDALRQHYSGNAVERDVTTFLAALTAKGLVTWC